MAASQIFPASRFKLVASARLLSLRRRRGRVDLKMRRLAFEKFAAAEFTDKYSIARRDLPAKGNDV
jgi:hypothetical protein